MGAVRVAVAGVNGILGPSVVKQLVAAGFVVTLLSRNPAKTTNDLPAEVKWKQVDYSTSDSIALSLDGQDAVVDLMNREAWETSIRLIDAAIAAKVQHFITSSFGLNQKNAFVRSLLPFQGKAQMEDYVAARAAEGKIAFTSIQTSMFLDWSLNNVILPLAGGTFMLLNGGEAVLSMSAHDDIGKAIATALMKMRRDEVRNKYLFIRSIDTSQSQILAFARQANPAKTWTTFDIDTEAGLEKAGEARKAGKVDADSMRMFLLGAYGRGYGHFEKVDNDVLGIKTMSEGDLRRLIAGLVA